MVNATFSFRENILSSLELNGHALYDIKGQDIVCAAVSGQISLVELGLSYIVKSSSFIEKKEGLFRITCSEDKETQVIVQSFFVALKAIEKDFTSHLKITTLKEN